MVGIFWSVWIGSSLLLASVAVVPPSSISSPLHPRPLNPVVSRLESRSIALNDATGSNLTSVNAHQIHCSGEVYRKDLKGRSCADAAGQIPESDQDLRFGMRGSQAFDVPLPSRFISSDGRCIVEPMLKDNVDMAIASYNDIRRATRGLLYECAMRSSVGGVATDIGTDGQLGVIMTSFVPNVECRHVTTPPPLARCKKLIDTMLASTIVQYWGNAGHRHKRPDVTLPKYLREVERQCMIVITTSGPTDLTAWYEMWEAAQAVYGMCLRFNRFGKAIRRGKKGYLTLEIVPESLGSTISQD